MTDTGPTNASPDAPTTISARIGVGLTYGMFAIAGLMGLLGFTAGLRLIVTGEQHWGVGLLAMGVVFAGLGIGFSTPVHQGAGDARAVHGGPAHLGPWIPARTRFMRSHAPHERSLGRDDTLVCGVRYISLTVIPGKRGPE
jgi:hypothetical protein